MIYFLIVLLTVIVAVFLLPIKVNIYSNVKGENIYYKNIKSNENHTIFVIKILGVIPLYSYNSNKTKKKKTNNPKFSLSKIINILKKSLLNEEADIGMLIKRILLLIKNIKFNKLILVGGFNTEDYIKNAYINSSINTIICMLINGNQNNFNFKRLYYQCSISDYKYYLTIDSAISFSFIANIKVIVALIKFIYNINVEKKMCKKQIENQKNVKLFKNNTFSLKSLK